MRILVPTDFSPASETAYGVALQVAHKLAAEVVLLNVFGLEAPSRFESLEKLKVLETKARSRSMEQLREFQERMQDKFPVPDGVKTPQPLAIMGIAFEEIQAAAERRDFDLIVMGTHGATNLQTKLLGTNTQNILSQSPIPVLVVPENAKVAPPKHIAFALDIERTDFSKLSLLESIGKAYDSIIRLIDVETPGNPHEKAEIKAAVDRAKKETGLGERLELKVLHSDSVTEGIHRYMKDEEVDLLVMVQHRRSIYERIFKPSLTSKIIQQPDLPTLVFRQ